MLTKTDIEWLKGEFLPELAHTVKKELSGKLDDISTKLDTFIGEIQKRRHEVTLHTGQHSEINDRLDRVEKHLDLPPFR